MINLLLFILAIAAFYRSRLGGKYNFAAIAVTGSVVATLMFPTNSSIFFLSYSESLDFSSGLEFKAAEFMILVLPLLYFVFGTSFHPRDCLHLTALPFFALAREPLLITVFLIMIETLRPLRANQGSLYVLSIVFLSNLAISAFEPAFPTLLFLAGASIVGSVSLLVIMLAKKDENADKLTPLVECMLLSVLVFENFNQLGFSANPTLVICGFFLFWFLLLARLGKYPNMGVALTGLCFLYFLLNPSANLFQALLASGGALFLIFFDRSVVKENKKETSFFGFFLPQVGLAIFFYFFLGLLLNLHWFLFLTGWMALVIFHKRIKEFSTKVLEAPCCQTLGFSMLFIFVFTGSYFYIWRDL